MKNKEVYDVIKDLKRRAAEHHFASQGTDDEEYIYKYRGMGLAYDHAAELLEQALLKSDGEEGMGR